MNRPSLRFLPTVQFTLNDPESENGSTLNRLQAIIWMHNGLVYGVIQTRWVNQSEYRNCLTMQRNQRSPVYPSTKWTPWTEMWACLFPTMTVVCCCNVPLPGHMFVVCHSKRGLGLLACFRDVNKSNDVSGGNESWTHWGRVTHISVGKLTIIGSDNGLSPRRHQAIIWNNAGTLLIVVVPKVLCLASCVTWLRRGGAFSKAPPVSSNRQRRIAWTYPHTSSSHGSVSDQ